MVKTLLTGMAIFNDPESVAQGIIEYSGLLLSVFIEKACHYVGWSSLLVSW